MDKQIPQEIIEANEKLKAQRDKLGLPHQISIPISSEPEPAAESSQTRLWPMPWGLATEEEIHQHNIAAKQAGISKGERMRSGEISQFIGAISSDHSTAQLSDFSPVVRDGVMAGIHSDAFRGFLIGGPAGTGKTRLMAAICREMLLLGYDVKWSMARGLLRQLWNTYRSESSESEEVIIAELQKYGVLAVDDMGHEGKVSDAVVGAFHEILAVRHDNFKPTIITTNLSLDEISNLYDASIASRLGSWLPIVMVGQDRRLYNNPEITDDDIPANL